MFILWGKINYVWTHKQLKMKEHIQIPQSKSTHTRKTLFKIYVIALIVITGAYMLENEELVVDKIISSFAILLIGSPFLMEGKSYWLDKSLNWLFGLTPLFAVSPLILAITIDGNFHWYMLLSVPIAGFIFAIASIFKIINVIRKHV